MLVLVRRGRLQLLQIAALSLVGFSALFAARLVALQRPGARSPLARRPSILAKISALVPAELLCPEFPWHLALAHAVAAPAGQQR